MLKSFLIYLKNPVYVDVPSSIKITKLTGVIGKLILFYFGFIILSTIFILIPFSASDLLPDHKATDLPLTFKILILAPFYEELIFRLPLRFSISNFFLAIGTLAFLFITRFSSIYLGIFCGMFILLIPYSMTLHVDFKSRIKNMYLNNYRVIFYFLTFSFGILHLINYQNLELIHVVLSPLIFINQIFMGFILGFARANYKYGLFFSFLIHAAINSVFIIPRNLL